MRYRNNRLFNRSSENDKNTKKKAIRKRKKNH